eukprot:scaffold2523_cov366-Prasinococcus_capsulatus_cf.AAC.3
MSHRERHNARRCGHCSHQLPISHLVVQEGWGQHIDVDGISNMCAPVRDWSLLCHTRLGHEAQPCEHGEAAVLKLLDLQTQRHAAAPP